MRRISRTALAGALLAAAPAGAQLCTPSLLDEFLRVNLNSPVRAVAAFDADGPGPDGDVLVVAGGFIVQGLEETCFFIALRMGDAWQPVAGGLDGPALAMCTVDLDDDGVDELYVGGIFARAGGVATGPLARWDGESWSAVGAFNGAVQVIRALEPFDPDGDGPASPRLAVGGVFAGVDDVVSESIALFDGAEWAGVGGGVPDGVVNAITAHAESTGVSLVIGGVFDQAGETPARNVASWDGHTWSALGGGLDTSVDALASYDPDGAGPLPAELYVGGPFGAESPGGPAGLAKWTEAGFVPVGGGLTRQSASPYVRTLRVLQPDSAALPLLYVGGNFTSAGLEPGTGASFRTYHLAIWNGQAWSRLGMNSQMDPCGSGSGVCRRDARGFVLVDPDDAGPQPPVLYVAGDFDTVTSSTPVDYVARLSGDALIGLADEITAPALTLFDSDGPGPLPADLVVSGGITIGGAPHGGVARRRGTTWEPLGQPAFPDHGPISRFAAFDPDQDGPLPPELFATGRFTGGLARYDGNVWTTLGVSTSLEWGSAIVVYDPDGDGAAPPLLIVTAPSEYGYVAAWDGVTLSTFAGGADNVVRALAIVDPDGEGPAPRRLYAGGRFTRIGGITINRLASWNGADWESGNYVGTSEVRSAVAWDDDGDGPHPERLHILITGTNDNFLRWDGAAWATWTFPSNVSVLRPVDLDGEGPAPALLAVGGRYNVGTAGVPAQHLNFWNGAGWIALPQAIGSEPADEVTAVELYIAGDPSALPRLFVGGEFSIVGGRAYSGLVAWDGCDRTLGSGASLRGDTNCDATVNFDDIDAFVLALLGAEVYADAYPTCPYENADIDQNESVNFDDIEGFVVCLVFGGCP